ncbi:DUF4148 domain-containing protein [Paracidovorax anthurii]|uniref:Uncharacterized protein DUF4148 n=1 Tax=Paracidovorax anthurii TaxID=78229 RepID=A0A328ZPT8_9BURK|nr:DUF4148 domain-containing protein [Paracidovorax anthurii]RAR84356.1 uncharacterized protein DUF4148 [Paracidovorax anthurii]
MNRKHLIAIATLAFASAGAATAAPVSQEDWGGPAPVASQQDQQPLSRAEVIADGNLWKKAGLDKYEMGDRSVSNDPMYQERLAEYQRLRSGPEYVAEVRRLGGDVSAVASMYEHGTVPMTN